MDELKTIADSLQVVRQTVLQAHQNRKLGSAREVRLVAVSKTKPVEYIIEAYKHGQREFGENYVQELVQKSADSKISEHCPDIKWHFIGHLQSGKVNKLVEVTNLSMVETVDSLKLAELLNKAVAKKNDADSTRKRVLDVMLEVRTSQEASKHGFAADEVVPAAIFLRDKCDSLRLKGLMTIGSAENSAKSRPNPDFQKLLELHDEVCRQLMMDGGDLECSMGMSEDYEHAIEMGSSEVRVGSQIFGSRDHRNPGDERAEEKGDSDSS